MTYDSLIAIGFLLSVSLFLSETYAAWNFYLVAVRHSVTLRVVWVLFDLAPVWEKQMDNLLLGNDEGRASATKSFDFELRSDIRKSAAVLRLLDEVSFNDLSGDSGVDESATLVAGPYDRVYNRHNR